MYSNGWKHHLVPEMMPSQWLGLYKEEARQLIEHLAKCNYKAPSKSSRSSSRLRGSGFIEPNRMTAIDVKLDAVMNKLRNNERRKHTTLEVGALDEEEKKEC